MYIILAEGQPIAKAERITEADLHQCELGAISILDALDPERPVAYRDGEWVELPNWKRQTA